MNCKSNKEILTPKIILQSLYGYSIISVICIILLLLYPIILIISLFDKQKKVISLILYISSIIFHKVFIGFKIIRKGISIPPMKNGEKRIYFVNHASRIDGVLFTKLLGNVKTIMKESDSFIPVLGWIISLSGHVLLKKESNIGNKTDLYNKIISIMNYGNSILIFPEGTRSKDGEIGRFKSGGFKIALKTGADIYPIVFDTWNVITPGSFLIRNMNPTVIFLEPLKYENIKEFSHIKLSNMVHELLVNELKTMRNII